MANIPVRGPKLVSVPGNLHRQLPPVGDGSNSFAAGDLVVVTSGSLAKAGDACAVALFGVTQDASHANTDIPPAVFFGENHYAVDLPNGAVLEMSLTDTSGTVGSSGPAFSAVTVGASYGLKLSASTNYQCVDKDNTTSGQKLFKVLGLTADADNGVAGDKNPRILVQVNNPPL